MSVVDKVISLDYYTLNQKVFNETIDYCLTYNELLQNIFDIFKIKNGTKLFIYVLDHKNRILIQNNSDYQKIQYLKDFVIKIEIRHFLFSNNKLKLSLEEEDDENEEEKNNKELEIKINHMIDLKLINFRNILIEQIKESLNNENKIIFENLNTFKSEIIENFKPILNDKNNNDKINNNNINNNQNISNVNKNIKNQTSNKEIDKFINNNSQNKIDITSDRTQRFENNNKNMNNNNNIINYHNNYNYNNKINYFNNEYINNKNNNNKNNNNNSENISNNNTNNKKKENLKINLINEEDTTKFKDIFSETPRNSDKAVNKFTPENETPKPKNLNNDNDEDEKERIEDFYDETLYSIDYKELSKNFSYNILTSGNCYINVLLTNNGKNDWPQNCYLCFIHDTFHEEEQELYFDDTLINNGEKVKAGESAIVRINVLLHKRYLNKREDSYVICYEIKENKIKKLNRYQSGICQINIIYNNIKQNKNARGFSYDKKGVERYNNKEKMEKKESKFLYNNYYFE